LKIHFIGTGSAKTSLINYHTSLLISSDKYNLLIDTGDGISRALLQSSIDFNSIDGILLTHLHPDHFSGLASLLVQMKICKRKNPLTIFTYLELKKPVEDFIYQSYLFYERMDFKITYKTYIQNDKIEVSENFAFISRKNSHLDQYEQHDIEHKLSFYSGSFIFICEGVNIFFTGDVGSEKDLLIFNDHLIDILISEVSHLNFQSLIEFKFNHKSTKIFLVHLDEMSRESLRLTIKNHNEELVRGFTIADEGLIVSN
jgi:ribonuclease Z